MKIVIASDNQGKLLELRAGLASFPWEVVSQGELGLVAPEETECTFIENALLKARYASKLTGFASIADDSGLCVPALNGAPGIYSARYSGPQANASSNIDKLLKAMDGKGGSERAAYFYCAMVFVQHEFDPTPLIGLGLWHGHLLNERRGSNGFGYDPIFALPSQQTSIAELSTEAKLQISHRTQALRELTQRMKVFYEDA